MNNIIQYTNDGVWEYCNEVSIITSVTSEQL